ncbi:MAG: T9SS type A sorting domain-containing protein [Bacteroidota bacterium]|nr:T9SS type A sorting domain-containing protein [Bacteroidota bacterium]
MKKIYLSLFLGLAYLTGFSQFSLIDTETGLPAASSYTINVELGSPTVSHDFEIHNDYSTQKTIKVKRYLYNYVGTQEIYYCFGVNCYGFVPDAAFVPAQTSNIGAGGMLPNGQGTFGLKTDFDDYGNLGNARVLYVLYDVNNVNDSIAVEMNYAVSAVGIAKLDAKNFSISNPMPNPATSNVSVKYNFSSTPKSALVKIYNMVGNLVKEIKVEGTEGKTQLDVSSLNDGIYFYALVVNDKLISTKKLIVSK